MATAAKRENRSRALSRRIRAIQVLLHYANARPTERSWRTVVLGPFRRMVVGPRERPPDGPTLGVTSLQECKDILDGFRRFLVALLSVRGETSIEARQLLDALEEKAALRPAEFEFDAQNGLLVQRWDTKENSFEETVYAYLAFALQRVPRTDILQCPNCNKFFVKESQRKLKYCAPRCRNQALVRSYRQRHPDRYRAHHRQLMRRLRHDERQAP